MGAIEKSQSVYLYLCVCVCVRVRRGRDRTVETKTYSVILFIQDIIQTAKCLSCSVNSNFKENEYINLKSVCYTHRI